MAVNIIIVLRKIQDCKAYFAAFFSVFDDKIFTVNVRSFVQEFHRKVQARL